MQGSSYPLALLARGMDPRAGLTRMMGVTMAVLAMAAFSVLVPTLTLAVLGLGWTAGGRSGSFADYQATGVAFGHPVGMLASHLGIASMILVVIALYRFVHHRPASWIWSVSPGVRWRYGLAALLVAAVVFGVAVIASAVTGPGWHPVPWAGWFLVVTVLTSPLQALAEEVLFRGYLLQSAGLVVRNPWFAIAVSAVVFAWFHGTQNPWLFGSRLAFGLIAGWLVWRTGGIEAAVAAHVMNNLAAFGLAIFTGTLTQTRTITTLSGWETMRDTAMFAVFAAVAWWIARRMRVRTTVA